MGFFHDDSEFLYINIYVYIYIYIYINNRQWIKDAKKMVSGAEGNVPKIILDKFEAAKN